MEKRKNHYTNQINYKGGNNVMGVKINSEIIVNQVNWRDLNAKKLLKLLCTGDNEEEEEELCNVFMYDFYKDDEHIRKDILHFFQWKIDEGRKCNKYGQDIKLNDLETLYKDKECDLLHKKLEKLFQSIISKTHKSKILKLLKEGKVTIKDIYNKHVESPYLRIERIAK